MSIKSQNLTNSLLIFLAGILMFTLVQGSDIVGFESRFYVFALEMWRHGWSWFPMTYHTPYPDYPVLSTFIIYLFAKMTGELTRLTAILPSAIVASMTLAVTYLIGAQKSKIWGISAVGFLMLTYLYVAEARTISLDHYITLLTALSFYLAMLGRVRLIIPLLILGFFIRGPIGLVIPTGVVLTSFLLDKDFKSLIYFGILAFILLLTLCAVLLGFAYLQGGPDFVWKVIQLEVLQRMNDEIAKPFYYYGLASFGDYSLVYPVALLVGVRLSKVDTQDKQFLFKLFAWAGIILLGLSIPHEKKMRYLLAMAPALALIAGYLFTVHEDNRYYFLIKRILYRIFCIFPLCFFIAVLVMQKQYAGFSYLSSLIIFAGLQLIAMSVILVVRYQKEIIILMIAALSFLSFYIGIFEQIYFKGHSARMFVHEVEAYRLQNQASLVFYKEYKDGLPIKYLANMSKDEQPEFSNNLDDIFKRSSKSIILTRERYLPEMPVKLRIVARGRIGREPFVVLVN